MEFLNILRKEIRQNQFSESTEKTYVSWVTRFVEYHNKPNPMEMGGEEIEQFLHYLIKERKVSSSTRNQALNALVFMYKKVWNISLDDFDCKHLKIGKSLPVIFSCDEAQDVLSHLYGEVKLMASLLYGSGLRLSECVNLRIQDIDFEQKKILIYDAKGDLDRKTVLPSLLLSQIGRQIEKSTLVWEENMMKKEFVGATLPESCENIQQEVAKQMGWQYIFPARKISNDPFTGELKQHHCHVSVLQKAVKYAIEKACVCKKASCHTFRHSFAARLLESGYDIRIVQQLLGHRDVRTTMVYMRVRDKNNLKIHSPLDL